MSLILITGSTGRLGNELTRLFPEALSPSHAELDVVDFEGVGKYLKKNLNIRTIVHAAAKTSAEECEGDPRRAFNVNVNGTNNLVCWALKLLAECRFVYISTCIFDGARGDYEELETPSPINVYQYTKAVGERTVEYFTKDFAIVRTNFVQRGPWPYPGAFVDRYANYLFVDQVAKAVKEVAESQVKGVVHVTGTRKLSMYEVAKITTRDVKKLTIKEYVGPRVPKDMSLKSTRWRTYDL